MRTIATADVTVTLRLKANGSWGPDCTVEQVQRQAIESIVGQLRNCFDNSALWGEIVGKPSVSVVHIEMKD
jgi:hypothetical protein